MSFGDEYIIMDIYDDDMNHEPINIDWITGKTKKGVKKFTCCINNKWITISFFKSGHPYLIYDGVMRKDVKLKYNNSDKDLLEQADKFIKTL
jgi:hypothetical protein